MRIWWHRVQPIVLAVLSSLSFLRLVGVGFPTSPPDWGAMYLFLFPGTPFTNFLFERPLLIFLCAAFSLTALSAYRKRRYAFTNLSTEVTIDFITPDGQEARVIRDQKTRPNHPNISAYFGNSDAGRHGTVPKDRIKGWLATHKKIHLPSQLEIVGDDKKCDIIQICEPSFPFSTALDLLPDFIRKDFVHRHLEATHYYCFNNRDDYYEVLASRYPSKLVTLRVCFHAGNTPTQVRGQKIMLNGIEEVEARRN
jgi:hypothetical protein